jgi:hypothetical protein
MSDLDAPSDSDKMVVVPKFKNSPSRKNGKHL